MSSRSVLQAAASVFGTGIHGIITAQPNTGLRTLSAGINGGVSGATFFTIREFVVSPLLVSTAPFAQYERRRKEGSSGSSLEDLKLSEIRSDRLLDSGVSGLITGGILRGFTGGIRTIAPGAVSGGVLCTLLQYMFNESRILRLEYLVHQKNNPEPKPSTTSNTPQNEAPKWAERLLQAIGIKSLSDAEYLASLKKQRETHLKRIAELEDEIKREK
ncbi:hypothetical protein BDP27DRAFT_1426470 [Rhodocollybia butyracea]|uniref:Uncharacterized protein n=1 Tax=Rhodocollybia butyracea TaxID=206335 RepID=A0A9P5U2T7_9AGAR|nr:hypothetical protein BDP27DRAFT_1426470 [Rhodocollybia butyracea]